MKRLHIELNDIFIILGLILLASGLIMISVPLALGVTGGLLLAIGLIGAFVKGKR